MANVSDGRSRQLISISGVFNDQRGNTRLKDKEPVRWTQQGHFLFMPQLSPFLHPSGGHYEVQERHDGEYPRA